MLHAYCVRFAGEPAPEEGLTGLDGARVELLEVDGLGLWVSGGASGPPVVERLRDHDRVVRAALRSATPLPIRFGTGLDDAERALRLLRERRERFLADLERVAGRVEMGLRVRWEPPAPAAGEADASGEGGSGRAYLERRRRELRAGEAVRARAEEAVAAVERYFSDLELPAARRILPEAGVAGALAHLVQRSRIRVYRERVEKARNELSSTEILLSGPWAPYSFVTGA